MDFSKPQRVGRVFIGDEFMNLGNEDMRLFFSQMLPFRVEYRVERMAFEVWALSELFEECAPPHFLVPEYMLEITAAPSTDFTVVTKRISGVRKVA